MSKKVFSIKLCEELVIKARVYCLYAKINLSALIEKLLREHIEKDKEYE